MKFKHTTTFLFLTLISSLMIAKAEGPKQGLGQGMGQELKQKNEELKKEYSEQNKELREENKKLTETLKEDRKNLKEQLENASGPKKDIKDQAKAAACTNVTTRVQNRVKVLENSYNMASQVISNIQASIQKKIDSLKTAGKDTTKLEAVFSSFKTKSTEVLAQRQVMISQLKSLQTSDCSSDPKKFQSSLKQFNGAEKTHTDFMKTLKEYLKQSVLPEIKALSGTQEVKANVQ